LRYESTSRAVSRNGNGESLRMLGVRLASVWARLKIDTIEIWYASRQVEQMLRLRGRGKPRVDYRHIIDWLVRKPGAFEN
jgi:hypothetical protein